MVYRSHDFGCLGSLFPLRQHTQILSDYLHREFQVLHVDLRICSAWKKDTSGMVGTLHNLDAEIGLIA